jgi:hypothetical protein
MKRRLEFDPEEHDYGPASASVRNVLRAWAEVSWFEGPRSPLRAAQRFAEHHARCRLHMPEGFPPTFEARLTRGGWERFAELCARVRRPGAWDWKHSQLKQLSARHKRAERWSPEETTPVGRPSRPGDLFARIGQSIVWSGLGLTVDVPFRSGQAELGGWYVSYADMDAYSAIEWQLASRSDDTSDNPFLPLLDCYAAGILPFGLSPEEFELFSLVPES